MTNNELYFIVGVALVCLFLWKQKRPDSDGRLPDSAVTLSKVQEIIMDEFEVERNSKLKFGYTEKTIEKQLEIIFQKRFQHLICQYGLDGPHGQKIDFDIGHGRVGVELKLAHSVFKAASQDRMVGQLQAYIKSRYSEDNLLLVIICETEHIAQRALIKSITDRLEDMAVTPLFLEV